MKATDSELVGSGTHFSTRRRGRAGRGTGTASSGGSTAGPATSTRAVRARPTDRGRRSSRTATAPTSLSSARCRADRRRRPAPQRRPPDTRKWPDAPPALAHRHRPWTSPENDDNIHWRPQKDKKDKGVAPCGHRKGFPKTSWQHNDVLHYWIVPVLT